MFVYFLLTMNQKKLPLSGSARRGGSGGWIGGWKREARGRAEPPAVMEGSVCFHDYSYK